MRYQKLYACPDCPYEDSTHTMQCEACPQRPKPPGDKPAQINVTVNFSEEDIEKVVQRVIERLSRDCRLQPLA